MKKLTKKEKKLSANKLKTILAQPLPVYWPEIKDDDKDELHAILSETFKEEEEINKNARKQSVTIGLTSSLRAIQNDKASCVFFSADLKPKFVVNQAINLVLSKHKYTVALIVPLLEDLTEKHFGVKAAAFAVLKNTLPHVDSWSTNKAKLFPVPPILEQYYNARHELPKVKNTETEESPPSSSQLNTKSSIKLAEPSSSSEGSKKLEASKESANKWGDFISFDGKARHIGTVEMDVDLETDKALLINKIKKFTNKSKENDSRKESIKSKLVQGKLKKLEKKKAASVIENSDKSKESIYISLKMSKIQKNPKKIKKKKFIKEKIKK